MAANETNHRWPVRSSNIQGLSLVTLSSSFCGLVLTNEKYRRCSKAAAVDLLAI